VSFSTIEAEGTVVDATKMTQLVVDEGTIFGIDEAGNLWKLCISRGEKWPMKWYLYLPHDADRDETRFHVSA